MNEIDTKSYEEVILEGMRRQRKHSVKHSLLMEDPEVEEAYSISPTMFDRAIKNLVLSNRLSMLTVGDSVTYTLKS